MNHTPNYIGALAAAWAVMNDKTKSKPSNKAITFLICWLAFCLGVAIGAFLIQVFYP